MHDVICCEYMTRLRKRGAWHKYEHSCVCIYIYIYTHECLYIYIYMDVCVGIFVYCGWPAKLSPASLKRRRRVKKPFLCVFWRVYLIKCCTHENLRNRERGRKTLVSQERDSEAETQKFKPKPRGGNSALRGGSRTVGGLYGVMNEDTELWRWGLDKLASLVTVSKFRWVLAIAIYTHKEC